MYNESYIELRFIIRINCFCLKYFNYIFWIDFYKCVYLMKFINLEEIFNGFIWYIVVIWKFLNVLKVIVFICICVYILCSFY